MAAFFLLLLLLHMNQSLCQETLWSLAALASRTVQLYGPISMQIIWRGLAVVKDLFFLHMVFKWLFELVSTRGLGGRRARPIE
jgi:hypothetical protein